MADFDILQGLDIGNGSDWAVSDMEMFWISPTVGYVPMLTDNGVGPDRQVRLWKTEDAGVTWALIANQPFPNELNRMRFLLPEYQRLAAPLDALPPARRARR